MILKDVISNKQWDVGVDLVKIVFFMKLVKEIRINILVKQLFMYALVYIFIKIFIKNKSVLII